MYTKDKIHRITLRLNDAQMEYLSQNADMLGITPSELLRQVVNVSMRTSAAALGSLDSVPVKTAKDVANSSDKNVSRETKKSSSAPKKKTAKK